MPTFNRDMSGSDPEPGIGGYDYPSGPYGATGFKGSTSPRRNDPPAAEGKLADDYSGRHKRRRWVTFAGQTGNTANWDIPANPDATRDTQRVNGKLQSSNVPGGENVRNSRYRGGLAAQPGTRRTVKSSPNPAYPVDDVTDVNRYVYNGVNGGTDVLSGILDHRRMPYTGQDGFRGNLRHARGGIRGAVNDGMRFRQGPPILVNQGGAYGQSARGQQRHRPTVWKEPVPWTSNFYDTTHNTGSVTNSGTNTQVHNAEFVSPLAAPRRNRGF